MKAVIRLCSPPRLANSEMWVGCRRGFLVPTIFLCLLPCLINSSHAQVTASISGRVEDASGSPISGATIAVKSVETGATRVVTSDDPGRYRVLALPVGQHEVKVEKPNFKTAVRTAIKLDVGREAVVNLRLEVGA